jgi:hypothetical protein
VLLRIAAQLRSENPTVRKQESAVMFNVTKKQSANIPLAKANLHSYMKGPGSKSRIVVCQAVGSWFGRIELLLSSAKTYLFGRGSPRGKPMLAAGFFNATLNGTLPIPVASSLRDAEALMRFNVYKI